MAHIGSRDATVNQTRFSCQEYRSVPIPIRRSRLIRRGRGCYIPESASGALASRLRLSVENDHAVFFLHSPES